MLHNNLDHIPVLQRSPKVDIKITSSTLAVRDALAQLLATLAPLDLDIEESGTIELVVAEVLNNIVEHAYPPSDPSGPIHLKCRMGADGLMFSVDDFGRPMPDGQTPIGCPTNLDVDFNDMPEGGFGWFLIKDLAKDVDYKRIGDTNHLTFRLAFAR